jgi:hypothetical protein
MNWDAIGAIAELIGALGVIGSLIYLAAQIRQNTQSLRASAYDSITASIAELNKLIVSNAEVAAITDEGDQDRSRLSPDKRRRYYAFQSSRFRHYDNLHDQYRHDLLEESRWQPLQNALAYHLRKPGVLSSWEQYRPTLNVEFVEYVNALIRNNQGAAYHGAGADRPQRVSIELGSLLASTLGCLSDRRRPVPRS